MDSPHVLQARLRWVKTYERTGHAGLTCRRCGISRPTLRKWWRRYQAEGIDGLRSRSRRPLNPPPRKVTDEIEQQILLLRREANLGPKRIQGELLREQHFRLSTATIWKVLLTTHCRFDALVCRSSPNATTGRSPVIACRSTR